MVPLQSLWAAGNLCQYITLVPDKESKRLILHRYSKGGIYPLLSTPSSSSSTFAAFQAQCSNNPHVEILATLCILSKIEQITNPQYTTNPSSNDFGIRIGCAITILHALSFAFCKTHGFVYK